MLDGGCYWSPLAVARAPNCTGARAECTRSLAALAAWRLIPDGYVIVNGLAVRRACQDVLDKLESESPRCPKNLFHPLLLTKVQHVTVGK